MLLLLPQAQGLLQRRLQVQLRIELLPAQVQLPQALSHPSLSPAKRQLRLLGGPLAPRRLR